MAYIAQEYLVEVGVSPAVHRARPSYKGTFIEKRNGLGDLAWSDEVDEGRNNDVNDTAFDLSSRLLFEPHENTVSRRVMGLGICYRTEGRS